MSSQPKPHILFVEDNPDHAEFIRRALNGDDVEIVHRADGEAALRYLNDSASLPLFMMLDVKLPKKDGFEVLESLRKEERFRALPITMLSTTIRPEEIKRAYRSGANSFVTKPTDFEEFTRKVKQIKSYWMTVCEIPEQEKEGT